MHRDNALKTKRAKELAIREEKERIRMKKIEKEIQRQEERL